MLCMLLYFKLHASSVIVNFSELPYWASLDNSPDVALVATVFFGHSLQQWMWMSHVQYNLYVPGVQGDVTASS